MKALVASMLMVCLAYAGQITLTFVPQIKYTSQPGHTYRLWVREKMTDPWEVESFVDAVNDTNFNRGPVNITVDYTFFYTTGYNTTTNPPNFFFLQVDDEPMQSPMPPESSNEPPPVPGATNE